ncbi:hypothetical protein [Agromyces sp. LHK192]|uniref:hypothetical protein n=1 Tax=Agromyces sp. LHK192 TaxID=2498704 RepID=UPI000FD80DA8|nr:hypothetical protein [Agromyces sp. LHK192]
MSADQTRPTEATPSEGAPIEAPPTDSTATAPDDIAPDTTVPDATVPEASGRRRPGMVASIVITLAALAVGFLVFGLSPAIFATLYLGIAAAWVAIPYTFVAIVAREVTARRAASTRVGESDRCDRASGFALFRQRASLVTAIAMLVTLAVTAIVAATTIAGEPEFALPGSTYLYSGVVGVVGGGFAIVVNAPSIYSTTVVQAERRAIRERAGAWRLILASTILTTASWIAYCVFGLYLLAELT